MNPSILERINKLLCLYKMNTTIHVIYVCLLYETLTRSTIESVSPTGDDSEWVQATVLATSTFIMDQDQGNC